MVYAATLASQLHPIDGVQVFEAGEPPFTSLETVETNESCDLQNLGFDLRPLNHMPHRPHLAKQREDLLVQVCGVVGRHLQPLCLEVGVPLEFFHYLPVALEDGPGLSTDHTILLRD